jgi:hypothetical protein
MRNALKFLREADPDDLIVGLTSVASVGIVFAAIFVALRALH